ncbi:site-specific integrase [Clostridium sporogenes]|uniref:site-specific integrase n=1 Tax=Clostridium sporogenes TaxID=1509 RepID=UPI002811E4A3|nr:site-specific integrase [Clostridium sporogenes]
MVDLIEDFLEYCSYKNLSNKTIKSYNQTLVLFMRYLEEEKDIIYIIKKSFKNILCLQEIEVNIVSLKAQME